MKNFKSILMKSGLIFAGILFIFLLAGCHGAQVPGIPKKSVSNSQKYSTDPHTGDVGSEGTDNSGVSMGAGSGNTDNSGVSMDAGSGNTDNSGVSGKIMDNHMTTRKSGSPMKEDQVEESVKTNSASN